MKSSFLQKSRNVLSVCLVAFILGGCFGGQSPKEASEAMDLQPVSKNIASHKDIILPADLELDNPSSMVIETNSFAGGVYKYDGRVEVTSLVHFIKRSMSDNNWKLVGEVTSKEVMLAFMKPNKTCMIIVSEGIGGVLGKTNVELYVTVDLAAAKGLNPFGEPVD